LLLTARAGGVGRQNTSSGSGRLIEGEEYRVVSLSRSETADRETAAVRVRYWASARAAAGTDGEDVVVDGPLTLAELVDRVVANHPGSRLPQVLEACSVLLGDRPVASSDPRDVVVEPGATIEFLPPFAGG
jgi:sulfur-carrier protein